MPNRSLFWGGGGKAFFKGQNLFEKFFLSTPRAWQPGRLLKLKISDETAQDSEVAEFGRGASLHKIVGLFSPAFFPVRIDSFEHLPGPFYFVNMGNSYQTTVFSHYFLYILILPKLKYKTSSFLDAQPDKF